MGAAFSAAVLAQTFPPYGPGYGKNNQGPTDPSTGQTEWTKQQVRSIEQSGFRSERTPIAPDIVRSRRSSLKPSNETLKRLKVQDGDLAPYREFLQGGGTGVLKLLPTIVCPRKGKRVDVECEIRRYNLWLFANSYSFQVGKYVPPVFGDFALVDGKVDSWDNRKQTILGTIGDVSLQDVTLQSEGCKFLADFAPATTVEGVRDQAVKIANGVTDGRYTYSRIVTAELNNTIVMRSIEYSTGEPAASPNADVIVAMRVIKKDADGSITLIWKELDRKAAPALVLQ